MDMEEDYSVSAKKKSVVRVFRDAMIQTGVGFTMNALQMAQPHLSECGLCWHSRELPAQGVQKGPVLGKRPRMCGGCAIIRAFFPIPSSLPP
jgi:hypothetical protein